MNITVELISVGPLQQVEGKKYKVMEVAYKRDGKIEGKKLMDFAAKEAVKSLQSCSAGDVVEVNLEKDQNGYWQWKSVTKASMGSFGGGNTSANSGAVKSAGAGNGGSNYPTREERQQQQTFIIRQSVLKAAIDSFTEEASVSSILERASKFEKYVHEGFKEVNSDFTDMDDDEVM